MFLREDHHEIQKFIKRSARCIQKMRCYGDEFTSGLADYLATNHFYLSNSRIRPDYFNVLGENGNPKILMHIEDLPSSNKTHFRYLE